MLGFFIGLFVGSLVTFVMVSCLFKFCEEDLYWQGYYDCDRERGSNGTM